MCAHIFARFDSLWTFLDHAGVEPTNNASQIMQCSAKTVRDLSELQPQGRKGRPRFGREVAGGPGVGVVGRLGHSPGRARLDWRSHKHMEKSLTLVICMSPDYFETEWGGWNIIPCGHRDPTNAPRRFLPLLIKDCEPPDIIAPRVTVWG